MVFSSFVGGMAGGASVNIVISAVDNFSGTFKRAGVGLTGMSKYANIAGKAMIGLGIVGGIAIAAIGVASIKTAIQFESAFAGVRKTVELSEVGFADLRQRFKDLSTEIPVSFVELSRIGELAGQLGVSGVDNLEKFTRTIADISVTTNLTSEAAATDFARIANIMGEPIKNVDRMGSTVVDLGNNFATTEAEISNFATRIAGTANVVGFSTADIFAIGTAFSSVGVQAERGGSAVERVLIEMGKATSMGGKKLEEFGVAAGMTGDEFKKAFEDDAAMAFESFVIGLGKQGKNADQTLSNLGLSNIRTSSALKALAGAGDLVTKALNRSKKAWDDNIALAEEAAKRYKTTESKLIMLKSQFKGMADDIGTQLKPALDNLIEAFSKNDEAMVSFASSAGGIGAKAIGALGGLIKEADDGLKGLASAWVTLISSRSIEDHNKWNEALNNYNYAVIGGRQSLESWVSSNQEYAEALKWTHFNVATAQASQEEYNNAFENYTALVGSGHQTLEDFITVHEKDAQILRDKLPLLDKLMVEMENRIALTEVEIELAAEEAAAEAKVNEELKKQAKALERLKKLGRRGAMAMAGIETAEGAIIRTAFTDDGGATTHVEGGGGIADDFISRPGQAIQRFSPSDTIIGTKGGGMGGGITITGNNIYGVNADDIADALLAKLQNKVAV